MITTEKIPKSSSVIVLFSGTPVAKVQRAFEVTRTLDWWRVRAGVGGLKLDGYFKNKKLAIEWVTAHADKLDIWNPM